MDQLIRTEKSTIIYGTFRGEDNQELFRCPRETEAADLTRYINEYRSLVCPMGSKIPFINDDTEDLRNVEDKSMIGYWRMYYDGGWHGRWLLENEFTGQEVIKPNNIDCLGVNNIIDWFCENFPNGCDWKMKEYFNRNFKEVEDHRYLIKPYLSQNYKILIDTAFGNHDYPVRVYTYHNKRQIELSEDSKDVSDDAAKEKNIDLKSLKGVLLLRKAGNKFSSKEEQIAEQKRWLKEGFITEKSIDEWIDSLKEELAKTPEQKEKESAEMIEWLMECDAREAEKDFDDKFKDPKFNSR